MELKNLVASGNTINIDPKRFSVHDCCCVVKKFIADLPQPILTIPLQDLFIKSMELEYRKKLDAIRLLIHLLPTVNRLFLWDLLDLLDTVVKNSNLNRMTLANISTIFAPHFFRTNDCGEKTIYKILETFIQCLSFMIKNVQEVFNAPEELIVNAQLYLSNREKIKKTNLAVDLVSSTNLSAIPAAKFCATSGSTYSAKDYTEMQLAELYAQMHTMAEQSPAIKKRFLKKFNENKNGCTPNMLQQDKKQQELIKQSLKLSSSKKKLEKDRSGSSHLKSIGVAIKKKLMPTPIGEKKTKCKTASPKSIVPIKVNAPKFEDEKVESNLTNKNNEKTLESIPESQIPIAVITPLKKATPKPKPLTPIVMDLSQERTCRYSRFRSNLPVSERLLRRNSYIENRGDKCLITINEENDIPVKFRSFPDPKKCPIHKRSDVSDIKRKRVKYLASKYEALIASENMDRHFRSSPKPNKMLNKNLDDSIDSENYVSLSSIYTNKPLETPRSAVIIKNRSITSNSVVRSASMALRNKSLNNFK